MDSARTAATRVLSIAIGLPPGTQLTVTMQIAQPFPVTVTETLTLVFEPNAVYNADDPAVQFSSGGRTVTFTILAGETAASFPLTPLRILSGTVAGTIRIGTATSPESTVPVPIARSVRVITAVPVAGVPAFTTRYQSTAAAPFGGQFRLSMPFNVTGSLAGIESVTATNAVGASQPFTVRLR